MPNDVGGIRRPRPVRTVGRTLGRACLPIRSDWKWSPRRTPSRLKPRIGKVTADARQGDAGREGGQAAMDPTQRCPRATNRSRSEGPHGASEQDPDELRPQSEASELLRLATDGEIPDIPPTVVGAIKAMENSIRDASRPT